MRDKTIAKEIVAMLFDGAPELLTREEAKEFSMKILTLMTRKQKVDMKKKLGRCLYYIDAINNKKMDVTRVRSILMRKEGLSRQSMNDVCKPCDEIMHGNNL